MSKLIEKEGKFYKECGVVMLETNNPYKVKQLIIWHDGILKNAPWSDSEGEFLRIHKPQHIYITSDDEVKEGDWMINTNGDTILNYESKNEGDNTWREYWKKIIATTDTSLNEKECSKCFGYGNDQSGYCHKCHGTGNGLILSQPSDKFIQAYIDAYNKGEKIDKVLVEMDYEYYSGGTTFFTKLKDNDIIIKKTKDSWTKDELLSTLSLESLREKFHSQSGMFINKQTSHEIIRWIKDSL